jgi:hypothetical protein
VLWVEKKDSWLFVELLAKLYHHYRQARRMRVILDNYGIHDSGLVAWALLQAQGRIVLHPLPPYSPRNHTCPDLDSLMVEVRVPLLIRYFRILDDNKPQPQASYDRARSFREAGFGWSFRRTDWQSVRLLLRAALIRASSGGGRSRPRPDR